LVGNIKTPRLIIEEGVIFDGTCEIIEDKEKLMQVRSKYIEKLKSEEFVIKGAHRKKAVQSQEPLDLMGERDLPQKEGTRVT
jgi:hydroxymethylpyrimidine/phosphomethylpyrimidine kinase